MSKVLIKNTSIYIINSFCTQGLTFLLWIILAQWLPPFQIGQYALIMFIVEFFSALAIFGLDSAVTRFYYTKESISSILSNTLFIFLASSLLSLTLFSFLIKLIPFVITGLSDILERRFFLLSTIIFINSLVSLVFVHYSALRKAGMYTGFQLLRALCFSFFSLLLVYMGLGILGVFYAFLFSSMLIVGLFLISEKKTISLSFVSSQTIKNLTSYSFPLMLYSSFGVLALYFSRILLNKYTDLASMGIYSFFLTLTLQINGMWSSFNRAWTPEVFLKFLQGEKEKVLRNIKLLGVVSSLGYLLILSIFVIAGQMFLFDILFKPEYLSKINLFLIILLGPLFTSIYTVAYPLYYENEKKTHLIFLTSFINSILTILLNLFFVSYFKETGAALAFFIIYLLTNLTYFFVFKKTIDIPWELIKWSIILSLIMMLNVAIFLILNSHLIFVLINLTTILIGYRIIEGEIKDLSFVLSIKRFINK